MGARGPGAARQRRRPHEKLEREVSAVSVRTDLAVECIDPALVKDSEELAHHSRKCGGVEVTTTHIKTAAMAQKIGKPVGRYVTVTFENLLHGQNQSDEIIDCIAGEIAPLLPESGGVLVIGLGNPAITPDAVGPQTAGQVLATRHIPVELAQQLGLALRPVSVLAPGVLGQTGMEVQEIARSLTGATAPSCAVVIDALAAGDTQRLGSTIQISDAGIAPGSGVGNARKELSQNTLGVPVIAMGLPTVVDAATLVEHFTGRPCDAAGSAMMVTNREIDLILKRGCAVMAAALNRALQPSISPEDMQYLVS
nr:GPR endopeptidase [Neobittarella massiliensis]